VSPQPPDEDDVDELYRRASARDSSGPSESVKSAVLRHAAELAAQRAAQATPDRAVSRGPTAPVNIDAARERFKRPAASEARWRPATYGGLAAAALAGLLIAPHFFPPSAPPSAPPAAKQRDAAPAPALQAYEDKRGQPAFPAAPATSATPALPAAPALPESPALPATSPRSPALAARRAPSPAPFVPTESPPAEAAQLASRAAPPPPDQPAPRALASEPQAFAGTAAENRTAPREFDSAAKVSGGATARAPSEMSALAEVARPMNPAAALRQAAQSGNTTRVNALLDEQVDIDARDASGRTALMLAVLHGQSQAVDALLARGADPNAADSSGATPLQAAEAARETAISDALRRAGAR